MPQRVGNLHDIGTSNNKANNRTIHWAHHEEEAVVVFVIPDKIDWDLFIFAKLRTNEPFPSLDTVGGSFAGTWRRSRNRTILPTMSTEGISKEKVTDGPSI